MSQRLARTQIAEAASVLDRLIAAVRSGELSAPESVLARLEGAGTTVGTRAFGPPRP